MDASLGGYAPKYRRIADALRKEIQDGEHAPGERMPSETSLMKRFHVSLPTMRDALKVLRAEGVIESVQGIGTFVRENRRLQRRSRHRYGRARADQQLLTANLRHDIIFAGRQAAPSHVAEVMNLAAGEEVVVRRRVLYDKQTNQPEEVGASYIPVKIAGGSFLEEPTVVPKALFLCVEDLSGKRYHHARDQWTSRIGTQEETELLKIPAGSQVLHVVHTAESQDDTVLEVSESIWPANRVVIIDEYPISQTADNPTARSDV